MNWWNYLIQINICLSLFYLFYALLLRNETFFKLNRIYLLSAATFSFLIPLIESEWISSFFVNEQVVHVTGSLRLIPYPVSPVPGHSHTGFLTFLYFSGIIFFSIRLLWQLCCLQQNIQYSTQPWSFFRKIHINEMMEGKNWILKHEETHVAGGHSLDVILFEIVAIINWFNPLIYLYKRSIKLIHEFIADDKATSDGEDKGSYSQLLVSHAFGMAPQQLFNSFSTSSQLRRRLKMLYKSKSPRIALFKYGLSAPLFLALVILSSATTSKKSTFDKLQMTIQNIATYPSRKVPSNEASLPIKKALAPTGPSIRPTKVSSFGTRPAAPAAKLPEKNNDDESIHDFASIEEMPDFPGGMKQFYSYVSQNYRYPQAARQAGLSGRLIISFIVEKDGTLSDIKVLRDLGMGTGEEAVSMLGNSPKWIPGMQKGQPVRVQYTLPISLSVNRE